MYAEVAYLTSGLTCNNQQNNNTDKSITICIRYIRAEDRRNFECSAVSMKTKIKLQYRVGFTSINWFFDWSYLFCRLYFATPNVLAIHRCIHIIHVKIEFYEFYGVLKWTESEDWYVSIILNVFFSFAFWLNMLKGGCYFSTVLDVSQQWL